MTRGTVDEVVQLVAYRTCNQEVAGLSHTWSTAGGAFSQLRFRKRGMTSFHTVWNDVRVELRHKQEAQLSLTNSYR